MGINKVNIYTDLAKAAVKKVKEMPKPGMIWPAIISGIKEQIGYYIELFGGKGKAWLPADKGVSGKVIDLIEK